MFALIGCLKPGDQKVRPSETPIKPISIRPITAEMVTPDSALKVSDQLNDELDREARKKEKAVAKDR